MLLGLHLKEQGEINRLLYQNSKKHHVVARLKCGDPFVFSRGFEEMRYLRKKGVLVEVVPGVSSAISGPETFGIPLTLKNKISSFAVIAGRKKDIRAPIEAPSCGTLIYLMPLSNIVNVVKALIASGRSHKTPCALIERATYSNARVVSSTLETIREQALRAKVEAPAILVVGEAVNYR